MEQLGVLCKASCETLSKVDGHSFLSSLLPPLAAPSPVTFSHCLSLTLRQGVCCNTSSCCWQRLFTCVWFFEGSSSEWIFLPLRGWVEWLVEVGRAEHKGGWRAAMSSTPHHTLCSPMLTHCSISYVTECERHNVPCVCMCVSVSECVCAPALIYFESL